MDDKLKNQHIRSQSLSQFSDAHHFHSYHLPLKPYRLSRTISNDIKDIHASQMDLKGGGAIHLQYDVFCVFTFGEHMLLSTKSQPYYGKIQLRTAEKQFNCSD